LLAELQKQSKKTNLLKKSRPLIIKNLVWRGKNQPGPSAVISRRASFCNQCRKGSGGIAGGLGGLQCHRTVFFSGQPNEPGPLPVLTHSPGQYDEA